MVAVNLGHVTRTALTTGLVIWCFIQGLPAMRYGARGEGTGIGLRQRARYL